MLDEIITYDKGTVSLREGNQAVVTVIPVKGEKSLIFQVYSREPIESSSDIGSELLKQYSVWINEYEFIQPASGL